MKHARTCIAALVIAVLAMVSGGQATVAQAQAPPPQNVTAVNGPNPGEARVSWNPPTGGVPWYRVGWVATDDVEQAFSSGGDALERYVFADIAGTRTSYTVTQLRPGEDYIFTVASIAQRFTPSSSAELVILTLNDATTACPSDGTPIQPPATPAGGDYDSDNDGLIEIRNLTQLDAIRHDLDGDGETRDAAGTAAYNAAFPDAATGMGCPSGCTGYELANSLDFGTQSVAGWLPIGGSSGFRATFDGGGHTISNMFIARGNNDYIGLFGSIMSDKAEVKRLGLVSVTIRGRDLVGGLAGVVRQGGTISDSYVTGDIVGVDRVGGLVGLSRGIVTDSYSTAVVSGRQYVGGAVGAYEGGTISASHATGAITAAGERTGGLIGHAGSGTSVSDSYATGHVTSTSYAGGLIGSMSSGASITASHATGNTSCTGSLCGGLVGYNNGGVISASYAAGNVNNPADHYWASTGGLVGENSGIIIGSYASGDASGRGRVGGLVGLNSGTLTATYSVGRVSFAPPSDTRRVHGGGGLVGIDGGGAVNASYWDTQTSGQNASGAGVGKTTRELQSPTSNSGIYATWNPDQWDFGTSSQYPVLKYRGMDVAAQR